MGLDIRITERKKNRCPHCGQIANYTDIEQAESSGRVWYEFLTSIGYYVPNAENNEWYAKDMVLTKEQILELYKFAYIHMVYNFSEILRLIALANIEEYDIVVNADW